MTMLGQGRASPSNRQYEKERGDYSSTVTLAAVPRELWMITPTVATERARTDGLETTIYTLDIENQSGGQAWVWLEDEDGNDLTVHFPLANNQELSKDWPAGMNLGDIDIYVNGTAGATPANVRVNISSMTEE